MDVLRHWSFEFASVMAAPSARSRKARPSFLPRAAPTHAHAATHADTPRTARQELVAVIVDVSPSMHADLPRVAALVSDLFNRVVRSPETHATHFQHVQQPLRV